MIVQVARLTDGTRKVVSVQEISGMEGEMITLQEIFSFRQLGINADGSVNGYFGATGVRPRFLERLRAFGIALPDEYFDPSRRFA